MSTPKLLSIALVTFAAAAFLAPVADARSWTSTDGRSFEATFLRIEGENFIFRMPNGQLAAVPRDRFVRADQEAAERFDGIGENTATLASARQIDTLLAQELRKHGFTSFNAPLPDDLFVRRVYLDIAGRIPTREEFRAFAESAREDKREALIDELLLSPGFASHLFNYFADMYRLHASDFNNGVRMDPYIHWWREQLRENRPYNEIVRDMILAEGNVGQNPAAGFILRDTGMEFDAFANFGQIMLGIDISCAQCHDHPFDEWSQGDFYQMAAFFGNTQRSTGYRSASMMGGGSIGMPNAPDGWAQDFNRWAENNKGIIPNDLRFNQFRFFVRALGWNVTDNDNLETLYPHDFIGGGGRPNEVARPRTLIGSSAKMGGKTRREALADWLVADDNPRFAMVIANRMWSRAFGRALVEPVGDFGDIQIRGASQPEVLKFVAAEMKRVNYDLREFMRIIYNTRAYQSVSTAEEPDWADTYYFQGPLLRRMRAEQAWDSMMTLAHGAEIDHKQGPDGSFYRKILDIDFHTASHEDVWRRYEMWQSTPGGRMAMAVVSDSSDDYTPTILNDTELRASDLPQPSPGASLLGTFGQSNRIVTDDHNFDGSVPQVLALMNGPVTRQLTGAASKIVDDLAEFDGPDDKVRGVFFTLLNRFPNEEELRLGMGLIEDYGDAGVSDLAWALMNSPEFLFIQ